ncbi:MAG TPA: hypothetical protein DCS07_06975 [Bdellovibrionales bacterium]|nr:MAG: hypothetical protein A2Z97_10520 [Bdellovibrionales bacterium GWB1_52_6]OFZ06019.1 MAG: hypothetical protein A2X97_01640 [Bdellovibrionales bacterium GWA1_52_35]OFZ39857.1 MAG: hypothetical protein A2070_03375 [Bdellovibrionales bacterium GWC1_52_8]HAR42361.1 hypothetical protein [Bdellovibrionales bacterium]HCM39356.1 hypothetical protein [Bdellovibrionales bacterium]
MENSGKILFEDDSALWFVALGEHWLGPLSASSIYRKIQAQEISWAHFVWKQGQTDWKRICDVKSFQAVVPNTPTKSVSVQVKEAAKPEIRQAPRRSASPPPVPSAIKPEERSWFLYYNGSQFGPFSKSEVEAAIRGGKINGKVFVWKDGMQTWQKLEEVDEFRSSSVRPPAPPKGVSGAKTKKEARSAPRRPLVAKIVMAQESSVSVGVCRDISIGGMQVLTDRGPSTVGKKIKLNVSAPGQIEPFVAEGVVVRILEDGRGFSFRFEKLSTQARDAVESYLQTDQA